MIGNRVVSSLKWLASGRLAGQAIATIVSIVVIRLLEPADYGLMAMALIFVGFILLLNEMGLGSALIQQATLSRREMEQVFGLLLVVNCLLYGAVYLAAPLVAAFFKEPRLVPILQVLALRLPMNSLLVVPRAMLQRNMQFRPKAMVDFAGMTAASLATLTLAWLGHGVWSLVYGVLIGAVVEIIGMLAASRLFLRPRFSLRGMGRQAKFGGFLTADSMLWYFYTQSDSVIIGRLLGNEILGIYFVAKRLASMPLDRLGSIVREVAFSAYSRVQGDMPGLRLQYCKAARLASLFGFPVCFGMSAVAPDAVPIILGAKWTESVVAMQLIALVVPLRQLNTLNTPALQGIGRPEVNVYNLLLALVIMPAAFLIGSRWGIFGVAMAWVVGYPIYFLAMLRRSLPILGISWRQYGDAVWPAAAAAVVMYATVAAVQWMLQRLSAPALVSLILGILTGAAAFSSAMWLIRRESLHELRALVRRK